MAKCMVPFGKINAEVEIPDKNLLYYAAPIVPGDAPDQVHVLEEALDHPIGTPKLEEMVHPGQKIAVLLDDITRPTPKKKILPHVLKRLKNAGIPKSDIKIILALGTHRTMSDNEIEEFIGFDTIEGYELVNIDYKDTSRFVDLGTSPNGTPIHIYREVLESDFKIAIGNIVPHIAAGWGGGAKMIQPGVCSERTTEITHLVACTKQKVLETCGTVDNLCRREMEEIAGKVGLDFIINTVLDEHKNMLGVYCGHFIEAHRAGVKHAEKVMCTPIPAQADILISSANPAHIDFWQGCKPYVFSQYGVREGGVMIFVIDACEGLCGNAPQHEATLRKYLLKSFDELCASVDAKEITDIVGINVPLFHSTVRHRVKTICVTHSMTKRDVADLGFEWADSIEDALKTAFEIMGNDATVGVIPYGGETLVRPQA